MTTLEQAHSRSAAAASAQDANDAPRAQRVAFLLSRYPAISHTFLLLEVLGLRARGVMVETISINQPDRPLHRLPSTEAAEARATHYLKGERSKLGALVEVLGIALRHPVVTARGMAAIRRLRGLTLRQRLFWHFYLAEALLVGQWMRQRGLHHLHVHFGGPVASVGMLVSAAWGLPYSLTIHGPEELQDVSRHQLRAKLDQASFVVCISDFCRSQLCQLTPPEEWNKFTVVRLGVDPAALLPAPRSSSPQTQPLRLVCTGRLVPEKGHRVLLEAILDLAQRGVALNVVLIGDGPERPMLEGFVRRHSLRSHISFAGALSHAETLRHVRAADIFVLASFAEGIPVALMEAMSFGVPCISTGIAGIPELIRSGHDGLLVAPGNVDQLTAAIESLLADPALRRFLGGSARQRIIRDYNLPLNQERLAAHFASHLPREVRA